MKVSLVLLLILAGGCAFSGNVVREFSDDIEIYFCPRDNCSVQLVNLINNAQKSVDCAFYDLDLQNVVSAIAEKSRHVDARIVIDNDNSGSINGTIVRFDDSRQLTHNKFCVIDNRIVWTGSFNPTNNGDRYNNNNVVVVHSRTLAENYKDEFEELWEGDFGKGSLVENEEIYVNNIEVENYFCPEDNCEQKVADVLSSAERSVYFMTFSFTSEPVADALLFLKDVELKGIFEKRLAGSRYSQFARLRDFGVDVKVDNNSKSMHHKTFIVDGKIVITGSYNPTKSGNTRNDENILIIYDEEITQLYIEEFDYLWQGI